MIIQLDNVSFSYGATQVLRGVSFGIERGEFVAVVGPNGSGKSTLAKLCNALLLPEEGRVLVDGTDTAQADNLFPIRKTVGMVFQNPDHQIVSSLVENDVAFGLENLGIEPEVIRQRVGEALEAVGLAGFNSRSTTSLSGGQKQRLAIAGVLAMQPEIIVFDEASAMLDPAGSRVLMGLIRQLNERGITIIMITHDLEEAAQAQRVLALYDGRIAFDGAPEDILTKRSLLGGLAANAPFAARMSWLLQERGVNVHTTINPEKLEEELCSLTSSK